MGCEFPEHHGSSGGGGIPTVLLGAVVAIIAAAAITAISAIVSVLAHILAIAVPIALGLGLVLLGWRVKRGRPLPLVHRRARAVPWQERPELGQQAGGTHLHFHGVSAEEVAAIIRQRRLED